MAKKKINELLDGGGAATEGVGGMGEIGVGEPGNRGNQDIDHNITGVFYE